mmetsp:Transcript_89885/g.238801  ORF Transcript_89885/g.238801 Transcript_89885/m.238801 type:complete len:259 (-) Transcript_89885:74-850(-)
MMGTVLSPTSMFCCGCPVRFGVGSITLGHLVLCCFYVVSACCNLIFKDPFFSSSWSPLWQVIYAAFCLVGIPVTIMAFWGVLNHREVNLRIYLFYLACSCVVNLAFLIYICLIEDACNSVRFFMDSLSGDGRRQDIPSGQAFACGVFRIASYLFVAIVVAVELYCLYVVWSMCEDVHSGRGGPEFAELIKAKDLEGFSQKRRRPAESPYASVVGFERGKAPGAYPSVYGTLFASDRGSIFGGRNHETSYPPRHDDSCL